MIYNIAQHELLKFFRNGRIWKLLALCQFILGLIFYWLTEEFISKSQKFILDNNTSLGNITEEVIHPLFAWTAIFFFFITPLLAANTLTQERKLQTLDLYLVSSISPTSIILGKFLGTWASQFLLLFPVISMSFFLLFTHTLDLGQLTSGFLGLLLLLTTSLSLGIFVSSFSKEPLICALVIFVALFLLSLLEWISSNSPLSFFSQFSLLYHCKDFFSGLISTKDLIYYLLTSLIFLGFSVLRLNKEHYFKRKV